VVRDAGKDLKDLKDLKDKDDPRDNKEGLSFVLEVFGVLEVLSRIPNHLAPLSVNGTGPEESRRAGSVCYRQRVVEAAVGVEPQGHPLLPPAGGVRGE